MQEAGLMVSSLDTDDLFLGNDDDCIIQLMT